MFLRPRQVVMRAVEAGVLDEGPVVREGGHWGPSTLAELRHQYGSIVTRSDAVLGRRCEVSLAPWEDAPGNVLIQVYFQYSVWPAWVRPLR